MPAGAVYPYGYTLAALQPFARCAPADAADGLPLKTDGARDKPYFAEMLLHSAKAER